MSDEALAHIQAAERRAASIEGLDDQVNSRPIHKVGVIGAGTMGGGIAMNFANVGLPVTLVEREQAALDRGLTVIRGHYERSQQRGKLTADDVEARMALLTGSLDFAAVSYTHLDVYKRQPWRSEAGPDRPRPATAWPRGWRNRLPKRE